MLGLLAFTREQFALQARQSNGEPMLSHLRAEARGGDQAARRRLLNAPPLSVHVAHIWNWFSDPITGLSATRPNNGMALCRIPRSELAQWERDERLRLEPWERRALLQLDMAYCAAFAPSTTSSPSNSSAGLVEEV